MTTIWSRSATLLTHFLFNQIQPKMNNMAGIATINLYIRYFGSSLVNLTHQWSLSWAESGYFKSAIFFDFWNFCLVHSLDERTIYKWYLQYQHGLQFEKSVFSFSVSHNFALQYFIFVKEIMWKKSSQPSMVMMSCRLLSRLFQAKKKIAWCLLTLVHEKF